MRSDKYNRIIATAQYHRGPATIAHVLSTVTADQDITALPGRIIGKIANIRHAAYMEGTRAGKIDTWAYDGELDWLAGIRGTDTVITVEADKIIIAQHVRTDQEVRHTYIRQ